MTATLDNVTKIRKDLWPRRIWRRTVYEDFWSPLSGWSGWVSLSGGIT